ncbi:MAG: hypothetical protein NZZ41_02260 [Candidatus Dojkabacteria bacterium]|nr:hypothetical protein [Candidatus Dojkabacteria bacterium]
MKVKLLEFKNFEVKISDDVVLIKEFKTILDRDKSKDKKQATKYFTYIYLTQDPQSPYANFTEEEAHRTALEDIGLKEVPDYVIEACKKYRYIVYNRPVLRMLKKMTKAMLALEEYFETVNFTEKIESGQRKGALLHDPKQLLAVMERASKIIDQVKLLEQRAIEELKTDTSVKGQQELGYHEKLMIGEQ